MTDRKRGWSSTEPEKVWTPVMVPTPVFDGVDEKNRYEDAWAETPRMEGESLAEHMDRVIAKAKAEEREPGADG